MNPLAMQLLGMSNDPTADAVSGLLASKAVDVRADVAAKLSKLKDDGVNEDLIRWAINGGKLQ